MAGRSPGLCLLLCAVSCALCPAWCFRCEPTNCGCTNTSRGVTVDLTAVDKMLTSQNLTVDAPDGVQYYLNLCTPLNLPDNCTNSLVCERNTSTNTYTSFGQKGAISYSVFHMPQLLMVVMTIGGGGAVSQKVRRSTLVSLALIPGSNNMVKLVSANTTTLEFSIVASGGRPLLVELEGRPLLVELEGRPLLVEPEGSGNSGSGNSGSGLIPTSARVPPKSSMDLSSTSSSSSTSSPSSSSSTSSPSSTSPLTLSASTVSPSNVSPTTSSSSTPSSIPYFPASLTPSASPYFPTNSSPPSTPNISPSTAPTPQPPTFPPHCTDCSTSLALGLGIGIPATAILSSLATVTLCVCCQRVVKRKRQYIRLAPTVYFDEEEHD